MTIEKFSTGKKKMLEQKITFHKFHILFSNVKMGDTEDYHLIKTYKGTHSLKII